MAHLSYTTVRVFVQLVALEVMPLLSHHPHAQSVNLVDSATAVDRLSVITVNMGDINHHQVQAHAYLV